MSTSPIYSPVAPTRAQIEALPGPTVIEFGNDWCGWCRRAQPLIAETFAPYPNLRHLRIADGRGRPLGRSFGVKFWPTLVFLSGGKEVAKLVRPGSAAEIAASLAAITR